MHVQRWVATGFDGLDDFALIDDELDPPGPGEVIIGVRAAGVNPADLKHARRKVDPSQLPLPIGYEVSGEILALGPDTEIASGGGVIADEVLAFRVHGGYATALSVPAEKVFAKPPTIDHPAAANLLLAGCTAADMLRAAAVEPGETILLHAASGAVGVAVLQLARLRGITVVGTSSPTNAERVREFGGIPVDHGPGLANRVRAAAPDGVWAALDAAGTDEAVDTSLELVADRSRIVTVVAPGRAADDGFVALGGAQPESLAFRDSVRPELIRLATAGDLVVPVARTFELSEARAALELVSAGHPGGKVALIP
ncbi:NADP-dependent oxidoreductase [Gordonia sp. OPL2]|uniref:NADP-dependent oxidoreductase n=1 Tax=Gordonia sp. OPL2 TaxID=2486274 RepID=UPI001654D342|nr:NADP-dependent oxidoreductase [Gordonia sp. OPL2]RPA12465.1 NADP-dependent oxidoreductase [Gordonia sp. OPL2]